MAVLSYGVRSSQNTQLAFQNFVRPGMDVRSQSCAPIELLSKGVPYLVTNWHVVSGRDPFTGGVTSESQYIPAQFNFLRA